jgi:hypothetical protein
MTLYHISGLGDALTREVRRTMLSPEYGHPVIRELARGTGPCRVCLQRFHVGKEERLLFTYRPEERNGTIGAPGPVFIHAEPCERYTGTGFPADLDSLPLILEARAADHRIPLARRVIGADADATLDVLFTDPDVEYVDIRHGEAGGYITRASRGPAASPRAAAREYRQATGTQTGIATPSMGAATSSQAQRSLPRGWAS